MKAIVKRRFQRLFVVLTACWILFCLFIQPVLMAGRGFTHYQKDMEFCYEDKDPSNLRTCLSHAEDELQRGLYAGFGVEYDDGHGWSYGWYFRKMWQFLMLEMVAPPLLIYGLVWVLVSISAWIWRGLKARSVTPPHG
jgi:hypothetical protein